MSVLLVALARNAPLSGWGQTHLGFTEPYAHVLDFMLIFGGLYSLGWRMSADSRLPPHKRAVLGSCAMSFAHGLTCAWVTFQEMRMHGPWHSPDLAMRNTFSQSMFVQFSIGYMLADFFFYLLPFTPTDFLFIGHHLLTAVLLITVAHRRQGAIYCCLPFFLGEVTSPLFISFTMAKELKGNFSWAARAFPPLSRAFTVAFLLIRSVLAPPIILWFCYRVIWDTQGVPLAYRITWSACIFLGITGSQYWSYKLITGHFRQKRKRRAAAAAELESKDL